MVNVMGFRGQNFVNILLYMLYFSALKGLKVIGAFNLTGARIRQMNYLYESVLLF